MPPSRDGRARVLAAILVPVVLLLGVVGTGTLTRGSEAEAVAPSAAPGAATSVPATPGPAPVEPAASYPTRVLGLTTRTVSEMLGRRRGGEVDDALQAIWGHLTVRAATSDCFIGDSTGSTLPMIQAVSCRREVILSQTAEPLLAWRAAEVVWLAQSSSEHLHIPVFHAVSLGSLETLVSERPPLAYGDGDLVTDPVPILPTPVIAIGRFDDPRVADPRANAEHMDEVFTLERVAWIAGTIEEPPPIQLVAPPVGALPIEDVRAAVSSALPSGTVVLSHAYLPLGQLARVDAAAAGGARIGLHEVGVAPTDGAAVWYVRVMVRDGAPVDTLAGDTTPRRLGWVVLTADGSVLDLAVDGFSPD